MTLAPEFQRNAVWPPAAKAYLIDTILSDRPMPVFFFHRARSTQTGKQTYSVVDGQQRLRAIFEFLDDRVALTQSKSAKLKNKKFSALPSDLQDKVLDYNLNVEELVGYTDAEIRDIFVRLNKYVVRLSPQELRHAKEQGKFFDFVEDLAKLSFWKEHGVFSKAQAARMRTAEFAAELAVLLVEGPQDKKASIDLYYVEYQKSFSSAAEVRGRLLKYLAWLQAALPNLKRSRFRRPVDLYGLIAAIDELSRRGTKMSWLTPKDGGAKLSQFERDMTKKRSTILAKRYLLSAGRQTDNIGPRTTRIETLKTVLQS
jgi:hypothetical protein